MNNKNDIHKNNINFNTKSDSATDASKCSPNQRSGSESDDDTQQSGLEDDNKRTNVGVKKYVRKLSDSGRKKSATNLLRNQQRKSSVGNNNHNSSTTTATATINCGSNDANNHYTNHSYVEYKIFDPNDEDNCNSKRFISDGNRLQKPPFLGNGGGGLRRQILSQNHSPIGGSMSLCPGYDQYQKSLLEVPMPKDYGDASSDDLSSEWDSDVPERSTKESKVSVWIFYEKLSGFILKMFANITLIRYKILI